MKRMLIRLCIALTIAALVSCSSTNVDWILIDETEHFTFLAATGDEESVPLLAKELETNYDRITGDLQVTATEKFPVYIFADIDTFHQASGQQGASSAHIGSTQGTAIWLVSPLYPGNALDSQAVLTAGIHEFTHALVNYVNGSRNENNYQIPIWLNEGLAGYESRQMTPEWRAGMIKKVAEGSIPSISSDLVPDKWEQVKGPPYSITLVEYMIEEYGFDKIIAIIKSPTNLESILGVTIAELDAGWREYLHKTYR